MVIVKQGLLSKGIEPIFEQCFVAKISYRRNMYSSFAAGVKDSLAYCQVLLIYYF